MVKVVPKIRTIYVICFGDKDPIAAFFSEVAAKEFKKGALLSEQYNIFPVNLYGEDIVKKPFVSN